MSDHTYRLIYPPTMVNVPVVHQLIRKFDLTVNILRAQIDPDEGWLELQLMGDDSVIAEARQWLQSLGITVVQQSS